MGADIQFATTPGRWHHQVVQGCSQGARFAGMYGTTIAEGCQLTALLMNGPRVEVIQALVRPNDDGVLTYPSLSPMIASAFWYERAAHDLSGIIPSGHPRLDPLLLHLDKGSEPPRPGHHPVEARLRTISTPGPVDVTGQGIFAIPFGPVRSGVFESIEFILETPGEDIPHLNIRPHYKHRGIAKKFEGLSLRDGVLVAERVEGISSVAHALAFSHATESIASVQVPERAALIRVVHAELERMANHLDVAMRLCDAAGLAVATSRFGWHKEALMRLTSQLCGNRFGRNTIIPGGVQHGLLSRPETTADTLRGIHRRIVADASLAMKTPSFLDRIRGTGILSHKKAALWEALGPIARASGIDNDCRWSDSADAYPLLATPAVAALRTEGDAMARLRVRWTEIDASAALVLEALQRLKTLGPGELATAVELPAGDAFATGRAESAQGETLYGLETRDGMILRCFARSASFHNLVTFHEVFNGDVFTDFAFIEASFGLCYAGVAM
ncbi:MAG: NADH-quinone oxidoreductase subunit C [Micrococcaceae bacterium]|nr:NADH-quinone oxidoreductase subunit C [Micrococcaceae bacterium]